MGVRPVADVQDLADVPQCEPGGLSRAEEGERVEDRAVIVAVARRGPGRRGEQVLVLPEPDRLGRDPGLGGDLADLHPGSLTFQVTRTFERSNRTRPAATTGARAAATTGPRSRSTDMTAETTTASVDAIDTALAIAARSRGEDEQRLAAALLRLLAAAAPASIPAAAAPATRPEPPAR